MHTLSFEIPDFSCKIDHAQQILFLGSCFSDDISERFNENGFNAEANPFGTIFHPSVLARFIDETIQGLEAERIFSRKDVFLSWDAGAKNYGMSSDTLSNQLNTIRASWKDRLQNAGYLFITFGTAHAYVHQELNIAVGNCHKMPSSLFQKELTTSAEILDQWQHTLNLLKAFNPSLKVFFTVSPVRHIKDGIVENNQSKSILIQLVHALVKQENCFYFPSYEIVIDELRDYRYFKEDLVHPNELAIQYIWEKLSKSIFTVQTDIIAKTYVSIKRSECHLALHPESEESRNFQEQLVKRKLEFLEKYPNLKF
jgi:hypothetical protein